jgi:hypothetical protein
VISLLEGVLCAIEGLAVGIVSVFVLMLNGLIFGIGAFAGAMVALLPAMPEPPAAPDSGALQFINYFIPLAPVTTTLLTMLTLFVGAVGCRMALNWLRAL